MRIEGEEKVPDGPEMDEYKEKRKLYEQEFQNVLSAISGGSSLDPISLEVESRPVEDILTETLTSIESKYKTKKSFFFSLLVIL